jgi:lincosamide nucleotidyltransferase A/C/D/E
MPAEAASALIAALQARGVAACVGGGWAVDALVREQTRPHADLDIWVEAADTGTLFATFVDQGVDRIYPWPGDRPWNFVLHDGESRRVDLHMYELLGNGRLRYGSVTAPFLFTEEDLSGRGEIAGITVRCERPEFALQNRTGYEVRDTDRHDVAVLCGHFGLQPPHSYRE